MLFFSSKRSPSWKYRSLQDQISGHEASHVCEDGAGLSRDYNPLSKLAVLCALASVCYSILVTVIAIRIWVRPGESSSSLVFS